MHPGFNIQFVNLKIRQYSECGGKNKELDRTGLNIGTITGFWAC